MTEKEKHRAHEAESFLTFVSFCSEFSLDTVTDGRGAFSGWSGGGKCPNIAFSGWLWSGVGRGSVTATEKRRANEAESFLTFVVCSEFP